MSIAVLDASALVRALWSGDAVAEEWVSRVYERRVNAVVPAHLHAEVGNAFLLEHRVYGVPLDGVALALKSLLSLPLTIVPLDVIIADALLTAASRDLSVYDACYAVLAEAHSAVLVTADRKLAAACPNAELLT